MHTITVVGGAGNETRKKQAVEALRTLVRTQAYSTSKEVVQAVQMICDAFEGDALSDEDLKQFDALVAPFDAYWRTSYYYFLGMALDQGGQTDQGEAYLRRAAFSGAFDTYSATLAGALLVKRYGDRGELPKEFAELETKAKAEFDAKAAEKAKGEGEKAQEEDAQDAGEEDATL
jgi:hypothetical protein